MTKEGSEKKFPLSRVTTVSGLRESLAPLEGSIQILGGDGQPGVELSLVPDEKKTPGVVLEIGK